MQGERLSAIALHTHSGVAGSDQSRRALAYCERSGDSSASPSYCFPTTDDGRSCDLPWPTDLHLAT